jgi:hypothetical protein
MSNEEARGLTARVPLAALFASVALMPVAIWVSLIGGAAGGLAFTTILFFDFVLRGTGRKLSKQEIYLMNVAISMAAYSVFFMQFVFRVYFSNSPEARAFGVTEYLPSWWVPRNPLIREQIVRSFFHPEWVTPIAVSIVTSVVLETLMFLPLGYLTYQLYVEIEKLPFPLAMVNVELASTLGEREPRKLRALVIGFIAAFTYALLAYSPYIVGAAMGGAGRIPTFIPIPYADWTSVAESMGLHGALIGLSTDVFALLSGFVVPARYIVTMFLGSFAVWVVGNTILLKNFRWMVPEWTPGLNIASTWQWTYFHVWSSVLLGLTFASAIAQILGVRKALSSVFSALKAARGPVGAQAPPLGRLLAMYFAGALAWVVLLAWLLPGMPMAPIVFLVVVWPLLFTLVDAGAVAAAGYGIGGVPIREIPLHLNGQRSGDPRPQRARCWDVACADAGRSLHVRYRVVHALLRIQAVGHTSEGRGADRAGHRHTAIADNEHHSRVDNLDDGPHTFPELSLGDDKLADLRDPAMHNHRKRHDPPVSPLEPRQHPAARSRAGAGLGVAVRGERCPHTVLAPDSYGRRVHAAPLRDDDAHRPPPVQDPPEADKGQNRGG